MKWNPVTNGDFLSFKVKKGGESDTWDTAVLEQDDLNANIYETYIATGTKEKVFVKAVNKLNKERIEEFEKDVHAWAFFDKTSFLEKAKEADDWRLSGKPLGPLHGLPVAIKDIFKTDDMPTGYGTPIKEGQRSRNESEVVRLLKNAGAIIMGKTVTTELDVS